MTVLILMAAFHLMFSLILHYYCFLSWFCLSSFFQLAKHFIAGAASLILLLSTSQELSWTLAELVQRHFLVPLK
jgi:hypothetical protein